jgi:hypothetical protein
VVADTFLHGEKALALQIKGRVLIGRKQDKQPSKILFQHLAKLLILPYKKSLCQTIFYSKVLISKMKPKKQYFAAPENAPSGPQLDPALMPLLYPVNHATATCPANLPSWAPACGNGRLAKYTAALEYSIGPLVNR